MMRYIQPCSGVNQMWILKQSSLRCAVNSYGSESLQFCSNIKTSFDMSTLYPAIPHARLKDRPHHLIKQRVFFITMTIVVIKILIFSLILTLMNDFTLKSMTNGMICQLPSLSIPISKQ